MQHWRISIIGAALASAGLPLYIHFPHFAQTELGLSLGVLALLLPALRLIDMAQDPLIGWFSAKNPHAHGRLITIALAGIALGNLMLFVFPQKQFALLWSSFWLIVIFSSYSLGIILVYARTPLWARSETLSDQARVASFREIGMLFGVIILGLTPSIAANMGYIKNGYQAIGLVVAALASGAFVMGRPLWRIAVRDKKPLTTPTWPLQLLRDPALRPMLFLGFINALPVAITSTLFVFYVEDGLGLTGQAGPFLILFFLASGMAIPFWAKMVRQFSLHLVLSIAMGLALAALISALFLPQGSLVGYGVICIITGGAVGADFVLLPTAFSLALARTKYDPSEGFGLWSFASKAALVIAVLLVLPILEAAGFYSGQQNTENALWTLRLLYAALPAGLKCLAIWLLWRMPRDIFTADPA